MMAAWPMGHRFAKRLRIEWRDLLELVLLPGLAVVLPWALCFRIFRWLSRKPWLYREASEHALSQAAQRGWADKPDAWDTPEFRQCMAQVKDLPAEKLLEAGPKKSIESKPGCNQVNALV